VVLITIFCNFIQQQLRADDFQLSPHCQAVAVGCKHKQHPLMAREPINDLLKFLKPFDKKVQTTALQLREFVLDMLPGSNELIYDNYNALAIGYSLTDKQKEMFCHIAVYSKHVNIGFDRGVDLDDPKQILKGAGNRIRHITVTDFESFQKSYVKTLLKQAHKLTIDAYDKKTQTISAQSIVKSISANKKRPS
jgi:hypothetical protein